MPSPFPGMDPYLEDPDLWPDVHARLIAGIGELLAPQLRPRYVARVEQRTFLFDPAGPGDELQVVPDVRVVEQRRRHQASAGGGGAAVAEKASVPIDVTGLVKRVGVQRFLEIRDSTNRRIITVIEILSPSNKVESAGRRALLQKREQVCDSDTSWLEIDLLRRGSRTVKLSEIGEAPYIAYLDRWAPNDPDALVNRRQFLWRMALREPLPSIFVPLRRKDADVSLDLQKTLDFAYDRAAYDVDVNCRVPPNPPLSKNDARWAGALLREKKIRS